MRRKRAIFPIALACSLVLHATATTLYVAFGSHLLSTDVGRPRAPELVVKIEPEPADPVLMDFGDARGTGIGNNQSPGEHPMRAREADADQALLSRQPSGFGKQLDTPSQLKGPPGALASAQPVPMVALPPAAPRPAEPPAVPLPDPLPDPSLAMPMPQTQPSRMDEDLKPRITTPTPPQVQPRPAQAAAATAKQEPGVPTSAGKPLPQSESDSDPFARFSGTVIFHNGRLDQQLGRHVKTVNPQVGIAGELDMIALNSPTLIVEVHIEPTGRVSRVDLVRKSGSVAIDEPTVNAVYQWTFEPAHDKAGTPIPDIVTFAFGYR